MSAPIGDLAALLRSMEPVLNPGVYAYCIAPAGADLAGLDPVATVREAEGMTLILPEHVARGAGLPIVFRAAWITLSVHSDLQAVGLTAAFSAALGAAGISCNVIAGACHDHVFVPAADGERALAVLLSLQRTASVSAS